MTSPPETKKVYELAYCQQCAKLLGLLKVRDQQSTVPQRFTACWEHDLAAAHLHIAVLDEAILDLTAQIAELHEYIELRMGGMKPHHERQG